MKKEAIETINNCADDIEIINDNLRVVRLCLTGNGDKPSESTLNNAILLLNEGLDKIVEEIRNTLLLQ